MKREARKEEVTEQDSSPASRDTLHASPRAAKRARRMIVWMIAVPVVILLLALAGANWKTFHLAYAKHLMRSEVPEEQNRGLEMVLDTHLRVGMTLEEVRRLFQPARVTEGGFGLTRERPPFRGFRVRLEGAYFTPGLGFDEDDRLRDLYFAPDVPPEFR